jgi:hypothetical protein
VEVNLKKQTKDTIYQLNLNMNDTTEAANNAGIMMSIEEKIIKTMNEYYPIEGKIVDGCVTYHSTQRTHESFRQHLMNANPESIVYTYYLSRCARWIRVLKLHNQKLIPIFAGNGTDS